MREGDRRAVRAERVPEPSIQALIELVHRLGEDAPLHALLDAVSSAVIEATGFDAVVLHVVEPSGNLRVASVQGPGELGHLKDVVTSRVDIDDLLRRGKAHGSLRFVRQDADSARGSDSRWLVGDTLVAPIEAPDARLVGLIIVDRPRSGRFPSAAERSILELLAAETANVLQQWRQREHDHGRRIALENVIADSPVAIAIVDGSLRLVESNAAFGRLLAQETEALRGSPLESLLDPRDVGRVLRICDELLGTGTGEATFSHRIVDDSGRALRVRSHLSVIESGSIRQLTLQSAPLAKGSPPSTREDDSPRAVVITTPVMPGARDEVGRALRRVARGRFVAILWLELVHSVFPGNGDESINGIGAAPTERARSLVAGLLRQGESLVNARENGFIVICEGLRSRRQIPPLCQRLIDHVAETPDSPGQLNVGIAIAESEMTGAQLLDVAYAALETARRLGPGRYFLAEREERRQAYPG